MFTYVKAKNFKSLKDIEFNLNKTKTKTNKFISIYGENGSGKTNIVELFKLLQQLIMSRATDVAMNKVPKEFWKIQEEMSDQLPTEIRQIFELSLNLKEYRMLEEEEPTEIEYGFKINDNDGFYYAKVDSSLDTAQVTSYLNQMQQLGVDTFLVNYKQSLEKSKEELSVICDKLESELSVQENEIKKKFLGKLRDVIIELVVILFALMVDVNVGLDNHNYVDAYNKIVNEYSVD